MICYIYRSQRKADMYLYVIKKDDFSAVPQELIAAFGQPEFSMVINLDKRDKLARVDINNVREQLDGDGFYLQMPPNISDDQNYLT